MKKSFHIIVILVFVLFLFSALSCGSRAGIKGDAARTMNKNPADNKVQMGMDTEKKETEEKEAGSISDYFPQGKGDEWTYWFIMKDRENSGSTEMSMVITGKEKVGDKDCVVTEQLVRKRSFSKNYFEVADDKVTMYRQTHPNGKSVDYDPPSVIFKYPLKKGDKWVNPSKLNNFDTTFTVMGEEEIELPMGKIKAWRIRSETVYSDDERAGADGWYAKGIGMVKQRFFSEDGEDKSESIMDLVSYKVGGKDSNEIIESGIKSKKTANKELLEYFPVKIGSRWLYRDTTYGVDERIMIQDNLYQITGTEMFKGKEYIILFRLINKQPMFASKDMYLIDGDKVYSYSSKDRMMDKKDPMLKLRFPLKPGSKWEVEDEFRKISSTVIGQEKVEVPAGKFNAWKIKGVYTVKKGTKQTTESFFWYVKNIGLVRVFSNSKVKTDSKVMNIKNDLVLLEYKIPKE